MTNPFDLSNMRKELNVSTVKRRLFVDDESICDRPAIETVKRKKMVNPKRINTIPQAIEDYQKKHAYLKRLVFEKYYDQCQPLNKQLLRHPSTGFVFDHRSKLLIGKCASPTAPLVDLTPDEWQTVFERLILAQYLYKNPIYKQKVFTTFFQKRVEIVKRHEKLDFYIHPPTQIVIDVKTKRAVGRLIDDVTVVPVDDDTVADTFGSQVLPAQ